MFLISFKQMAIPVKPSKSETIPEIVIYIIFNPGDRETKKP